MAHLYSKPPNLYNSGAIIELVIIPPQPVLDRLKAEGKVSPTYKAPALIDTGATNTCIDNTIASSLRLIPRDIKPVQTAAGPVNQNLYDVGVILPLATQQVLFIQVFEAKIEMQPYRILIGRDILSHCTFIYNGWNNSFQIHL